jgi:hypothetical protein
MVPMMLSQVVFNDFTSSMSGDDETDCNTAAEQARCSSSTPLVHMDGKSLILGALREYL